MTPEEFKNLKVGDSIILYKDLFYEYCLNDDYDHDMESICLSKGEIGSDDNVLCLITSGENGWVINHSHIDGYNLDPKYLGKRAWWIDYDNIGLPEKPIVKEELPTVETPWRQFMYGRQIEMEKESAPPLIERAFEFL